MSVSAVNRNSAFLCTRGHHLTEGTAGARGQDGRPQAPEATNLQKAQQAFEVKTGAAGTRGNHPTEGPAGARGQDRELRDLPDNLFEETAATQSVLKTNLLRSDSESERLAGSSDAERPAAEHKRLRGKTFAQSRAEGHSPEECRLAACFDAAEGRAASCTRSPSVEFVGRRVVPRL